MRNILRSMWVYLVKEKIGFHRPIRVPPEPDYSTNEERCMAQEAVESLERRVLDAQRLINLKLDIAKRRHRHT